MRTWISIFLAGLVALILAAAPSAWAPTFSSGSTGSLGAFAPSSNTTVTLPADGILNYTTVTIPLGVTVTFLRNSANTPVTLLAQGLVNIEGTIDLNGQDGALSVGSNTAPGGLGGPGGYSGGMSGARVTTFPLYNGNAGQGPGGGQPSIHLSVDPWFTIAQGATYGAPSDFVSLLPLFGGSGGGGAAQLVHACCPNTYSGGGGGGAIVISSTTEIRVQSTATVRANGGNTQTVNCGDWRMAGAGSGGAIRLVAPKITNLGTIQAKGGIVPPSCPAGGNGIIRLESFVTGVINATTPPASVANTPGPVTAASVPALVSLPTLVISTIGGQTVPSTPGGSYSAADVTLPPGTTNPVNVMVTATNTPVPTTFSFRVLPPNETAPTTPPVTANSSGSFASSTATASMTLPTGKTSVLQVYGNYLLP